MKWIYHSREARTMRRRQIALQCVHCSARSRRRIRADSKVVLSVCLDSCQCVNKSVNKMCHKTLKEIVSQTD